MQVIIFSHLKVVFYGSLGLYNMSTASSSEGWTLGIVCVAMVSLLFMWLFLFSPACFLDRRRRPLRKAKSGTRQPSFSCTIRATSRKAEKFWTKLSESGATSVQVVSMRCQSSMWGEILDLCFSAAPFRSACIISAITSFFLRVDLLHD